MEDISDYLRQLSSAEPVPGGGSVAALQIAMGASLLVMVCGLTLGKKRYAEVEDDVFRLQDRAIRLRDMATALSEKDIDAYQDVVSAVGLPKATDEERLQRSEALQAALREACLPPFESMRVGADVVSAASELVKIGNRSAISDVAVAALAAGSGFRAAEFNVLINLQSITDHEWVRDMRSRVFALGRMDALVDAVCATALQNIQGNPA